MNIGLWADTVGFPSLPLMKLSAYHKGLGDTVELITENGHYDRAYLSKVFNLPAIKKIPTAPPTFFADEVQRGGTGYAIEVIDGREVFHKELDKPLPSEIEHIYPDYDLYPDYADTAYGFLTRGCCNDCGFCIVSKKEGRCSRKVADLDEFWRGQKAIKLLDPNILASRERESLLQALLDSKASVDFTQGLDARFIDETVSKLLQQIHVKGIHFAFDSMKNERAILKGLECFNRFYQKSRWNLRCYVLTNYDTTHQEDWYRVRKLRELGFYPYVMIYQKGTHDRFLTDLQRWCNNPILFKSTSFAEYIPRTDGKCCGELYPDILTERNLVTVATKKETTKEKDAPAVDVSNMNVWERLLNVRAEFHAKGATKTGKNPHAEFMYFELEDIVPVALPILTKYRLLMIPTFEETHAVARIINIDQPDDIITFTIPLMFISEPPKFRMNETQAAGAAVTYYRRYLYMIVLDLVQKDDIDGKPQPKPEGTQPKKPEETPPQKPKKPASAEQRKEMKEKLTEQANAPATEEQITELKALLKRLMEIDPENEEFIGTVAIKTNNFTEITADQCKDLIEGVTQMLDAYVAQE